MATNMPARNAPVKEPVAISLGWSDNTIFAGFLLSVILFLPTTVAYLFEVGSHTLGLVIALAIVLPILIARVRINGGLVFFVSVLSVLAVQIVVAGRIGPVVNSRAFGSLGLLAIMLISSAYLGTWLFSLPDVIIGRITMTIRVLLLLIAALALSGIQPEPIRDKSTFPFTEPSHYVTIALPFFLLAASNQRLFVRVAWLIIGLIVAYSLGSLSLLVGIAWVALVSLPLWLFGISAMALIGVAASVDISYFTDRLDLSYQSDNLSALVYLEGQELAVDGFFRSFGWGIGFQQLGFTPFISPSADRIKITFGQDFNLTDGSFLGSKLMAELGFLGILVAAFSIGLSLWAGFRLRSYVRGKLLISRGEIWALALVYSFFIELTVRGVGYFSGSAVMYCAAIYYIFYVRTKTVPRLTGE